MPTTNRLSWKTFGEVYPKAGNDDNNDKFEKHVILFMIYKYSASKLVTVLNMTLPVDE